MLRMVWVFLAGAAGALAVAGAPPAVIAHRGGPASRPENTIEAFRNAMRLGVKVIEFDMNVTADDQIVIHHDVTVNPAICSPAAGSGVRPGPIRLLALRDIRQFDCGSAHPPAHPRQKPAPGARMPTLNEFLSAVASSGALLLGETKMPPEKAGYSVDPVRFVELVDAAIRKHGVADRFILQSGDYRTIDAMRQKNPRVQRCLLNARRFKPDYLAVARRHQATHLMLRTDDVDASSVRQLQGAGLKIYSSTANREADWQAYLQMGVDGILTDDPEALLGFLQRKAASR
jgi:glycerophosphoryl diester phosphodiesterase